jgi:nitroimidazol reductase NimA-like FMN-containing flavoprotein (pyridoxamine 5'-phosphate oxidase superfamily)
MKPFPEAVLSFIRDVRVCRIASVRPDGVPHVIPVCPVFDGEALYIDVAVDGVTASGVKANGRLTVLIDQYDDDWNKLRAVILRTRAEPITGERQDRAWEMIRQKFPQYHTVDWNPRLTLVLHIEGWTQWGVVT